MHSLAEKSKKSSVNTNRRNVDWKVLNKSQQQIATANQVKRIIGNSPSNQPRIKIDTFNQIQDSESSQFSATKMTRGVNTDKSVTERNNDQDQHASVERIKKTKNGVSIKVNPDGAYSSDEYPDGFRWTQTITTNTKKGGGILNTPVHYVDPTPNDDKKPFYWTDAEYLKYLGVFYDSPSRSPRKAGTVHWDATLSLNGVNAKAVERFDTITYGFSVDSSGTVSMRRPQTPADLSTHMATLRSSFPSWSFI